MPRSTSSPVERERVDGHLVEGHLVEGHQVPIAAPVGPDLLKGLALSVGERLHVYSPLLTGAAGLVPFSHPSHRVRLGVRTFRPWSALRVSRTRAECLGAPASGRSRCGRRA